MAEDTTNNAVESQEKETRYNLGDYCKNGGPGRPKGSKNKFTQVKEDLVDIWAEEQGKEHFRALFKKDFVKAIDRIITVLPKEKDEDKNEAHYHLTVVNFGATQDVTSSRVSGIDQPVPNRDI